MHLQKIHIDTFKNFEELEISFASKMNCIIGKNGVGKTNLLDAIYYLSICKSNFGILDGMCVTKNADFFLLQGDFEKEEVPFSILCSYHSETKKKNVKCNGRKYDRVSEHIGTIPVVFITPSDITLINGGGGERRKFIDVFISQLSREYLQALLKFNKLLQQRNKLLKNKDQKPDSDLFNVLDVQLIAVSEKIHIERKQVVEALIPDVKEFYNRISGREEISIEYHSSLNEKKYRDILQKNFNRDIVLQHTSAGIHRDDISFYIDGFNLKQGGSQGQKKSFLLALRFAQYKYLNSIVGEKPLLLLDDLFDKLDYERCNNIIKIVLSDTFGQIFISDTDKTYIGEMLKQEGEESRLFLIEDGKLA